MRREIRRKRMKGVLSFIGGERKRKVAGAVVAGDCAGDGRRYRERESERRYELGRGGTAWPMVKVCVRSTVHVLFQRRVKEIGRAHV